MEEETDPRPVVCVDFNGVLDRYTGWRGPDLLDQPREGALEFLRALGEKGFRVVVFTTRYAPQVEAWLEEHGMAEWVVEVTDRKPAAFVFVDDRAVCFRGDFRETLQQVTEFRAHWEEIP